MTSARTDSSSRSTLLPKAKQQNHQPYEDVTAPPPSSNMEKATNADYSRPSFELPLTGHPEAIHSLSPQIKRRTTFEQKSEHTEAMERRIKRHWYPALVLSIALNVFLVVGAFYIIYEADYYSESRRGYLLRAFLIIFVPLVPIAILLFWPWEGHWKSRRDAFIQRKSSPRWPYVVNICNALGCFALTILYLIGAIPKYNQPVWESAVDFPGDITVPTVAMMMFDSPTGTGAEAAQFRSEAEGGSQFVAWGAQGNSAEQFEGPDTYSVERVPATEQYPLAILANVANISRERTEYRSALQTSLQFRALTTYNSTLANQTANATGVRVAPQIVVAAYDKRLTLEEVLYCNIAQVSTPLAFSSVIYLMSVSQISDPRRKMNPPTTYDPACERVYNELLPHADPPLAIFDLSLMASAPTTPDFTTDCDIATSANASCLSSVMLTYGTQFVTYQRSVPGKTKMEIWIDCGAIVGAVQFFAWFIYTFFQP